MTGQYERGQGFTQSPRLAMAQMLMQRGSSTAPVGSAVEGIARALTGAVGGYFGGKAKEDQREALADALKALENPEIPAGGRAKAAYQAFASKAPDMANPFEAAMLSQAVPKGPESPLGKLWQDAQQLPQDHPIRKMFETAIAKDAGDPNYVRRNSAASAQGAADVKLATEPAIIAATAQPQADAAALMEQAKNPALIARTRGQAQAGADVDLAMKPQIEAATVAAATPGLVSRAGQTAEANAAGGNRGQIAPVQTPEGPVPGAQAVAAAQAAPGQPGKEFDRTKTLRGEFQDLTKDFRTVQDAYSKIGSAAKANTGAGDMSMLYAFVKLLDPGSVVRESEFATAAASGSFGERVQGAVQRLLTGERMPDTLKKDFLDQASGIYDAQKRSYDNVSKTYSDLASRHGLKTDDVVTRFDLPTAAPDKPPPVTPEGLAKMTDEEVLRQLGIRK